MKLTKKIASVAAMCLLLASCNNYEKLLNSPDYDAKYEAAVRYYNNNSYTAACRLFENLKLYGRGREHAEDVAWYYAQSLYKMSDFYTAAYEFQRFASQYPYSTRAEEALYMSCYCKYLDSPDYYLDQTATKSAIEDMEVFAERFPRSLHMPDINRQLDELRAKLVRKDYEIAYGYYNTEEYHAAYESFRQFINLYPDAPQREDAAFYLLESGYRFAKGSRESKQRERLRQVLNDYENFSSKYGESALLERAQQINKEARNLLAHLDEQNNIQQ